MAARSRRVPLGLLFGALTLLFALIAVAAWRADVWVIGVAAGGLALWMGGMALRTVRPD